MSLSSPSHRAALWFLRGGLVASVALLVPAQFGFVSRQAPALEPLVDLIRIAIPAIGYAAGGAIGGTALGRGRPGVLACGAGFLLTGLIVSLAAPSLTGLTGFENRVAVLLFAASTTGAAFAVGGGVVALLLEPRLFAKMAVGFLYAGAAAGVASVLPAILAAPIARWPADLQLFVRLGCSLVSLVGPFAAGGAVAGRALGDGEGADD
jgi:hypothetical protein